MTANAGPGAGGGNVHTALLMPDGTVWTAGSQNNYGEIGDNTNQPRLTRVQVFSGATSVAVGAGHTVVASGGSLHGWGQGNFGQLCDPAASNRLVPTASPALTDVASVAAGASFTLARHGSGAVSVCGWNGSSGLGDGSTNVQRTTPVAVSGLSDITAVAAGVDHALALRANGTVMSWGSNTTGKLGDGTTTTRLTPVAVSGLTNIVAIAAGHVSNAALDDTGHVWVWGDGFYGTLGRGTTSSSYTPIQVPNLANVTAIAMGRFHVVALVGTDVWVWGGGSVGQLGLGPSQTSALVPTKVLGLNAISAIGAAQQATFAFAADGGLWGWGDGVGLGDGTSERRFSPVVLAEAGGVWRVGTPQFSAAGGNRNTPVTVTITSATAGATVRYTTNGATPTESDPTVPVGGLTIDQAQTVTARAFKAGMAASNVASNAYTFSVLMPTISPGTGTYTSTQQVTITNQTSGATVYYTLDNSEPTQSSAVPSGPIPISTATTLKAKAFRTGWTASPTSAAGYGFSYGTLPTPTATPGGGTYSTDQTVTLALPGGPGSAAIRYTLDGSNPGTGSPLYSGPITISATTTLKARAFHSDYTSGGTLSATYTMVAATPTFTLTAGEYQAGQTVAMATATANATIRYTLNGAAPTATDPIFTPGFPLTVGNYTLKAAAFRTNFTTSGVASAAYTVTGNVSTPSVATGATHTLVVKRDGTVWSTGANGWGYLGDGTTNPRTTLGMVPGLTGIKSVAAGASHSAAVGQDGRLYTWGQNNSRQLGDGTSASHRTTPTLIGGVPSMIAVAAGQNHTLALTSTGQVYAFGLNGSGQIGDGTQTTPTVPVLLGTLPAINGIAAGDNHSLAWTSGGQLYAWGANGTYQLGDGSNSTRTSPVLITAVTGVAQAAAGASHTLVRSSTGQVRAWGRNNEGQLGDGTIVNKTVPTLIGSLTDVVTIGAGANHSLASKASTTYAWGANGSWQLGDNATPAVNRTAPFALAGLAGSVQLAGGVTHSAAVDTGGAIWMWGGSGSGQLGTGSNTTEKMPVPLAGDVAAPTAPMDLQTCTSAQNVRTCSAEQSVVLSSSTFGAVIRYTLNGADPTASDSIAPATIPLAVNTTLKARAFKSGLDPSAVSIFQYILQLATPTISPTAGFKSEPPTIELSQPSAQSGATMYYTLDGNNPTTSSQAYSGSFALTSSATVKAWAFKEGWTPSGVATSTYEVRIDLSAPTLTARVRPGVNSQGWTMGPATVTFICHDAEGPVQNCPTPILVPDETNNQPYTRTVTDAAGRSTTVSGVVKVDATPPQIALTAPNDGVEVSTPFVTVSGTASDGMSGLDAVRCNDVVATVSNGIISCDVPLRAGRNPIVLQASDKAGHSTSLGIVVWRTVVVDALTLSPQQLTLQAGDEAPLRVVNNMGREQAGATWTVSEPSVVEVVELPEITLRALGPGVATVTATVGALTAQSTVTVVDGTVVLVPGSSRWIVQRTPGLDLQRVIYTHQTSPDVPETVLLESFEGANLQLRGIQNGMTTSVTPVSGTLPGQAMGDSFGGVLLVQVLDDRTILQRVGFTPEVHPWRWMSSGGLSNVVQTNDGTIFATERVFTNSEVTAASVIVLDGATGQLRARVPVTTSTHYERIAIDCHVPYNSISDGIGLSNQWALSTTNRYAVVTISSESYSSWIGTSSEAYCGPGSHGTDSGSMHLLIVDENGGSSSTQLSEFSESWPATSANSLTPVVSGVSADARGNFVFWLHDGLQATPQLIGPNANAPVQPVGGDDIVSYGGLHVGRTADNHLVAKNFAGQVIWDVASSNAAVAFHPERQTAFVREEAALVEVGPGAVEPAMPLPPGITGLVHLYEDRWQAHADQFLIELVGPTAAEPVISGFQGSRRAQGSALSTLCGVGVTDERTKIIGEYVSYGVGWQPSCDDFRQSLPATSHYAFGAARQTNSWNVSNTYTWALLKPELVSNLYCLVNRFTQVPTLNSGYRAPSDQWRAGNGVRNWNNAYHVRGLAADLDTPNAEDARWNPTRKRYDIYVDTYRPVWDDHRTMAKDGTCSVACVEPRDMSPKHFHVDYRPSASCPGDF